MSVKAHGEHAPAKNVAAQEHLKRAVVRVELHDLEAGNDVVDIIESYEKVNQINAHRHRVSSRPHRAHSNRLQTKRGYQGWRNTSKRCARVN